MRRCRHSGYLGRLNVFHVIAAHNLDGASRRPLHIAIVTEKSCLPGYLLGRRQSSKSSV